MTQEMKREEQRAVCSTSNPPLSLPPFPPSPLDTVPHFPPANSLHPPHATLHLRIPSILPSLHPVPPLQPISRCRIVVVVITVDHGWVHERGKKKRLLPDDGGLVQARTLVDCKGEIESCGGEGKAGEEAGEESHCFREGMKRCSSGGGTPRVPVQVRAYRCRGSRGF